MNIKLRHFIIDHCKVGEQQTYSANRKDKIPFKIGKPLSYGITPDGFPFLVWENRNFASILLDSSLWQQEPQSKLRNDICCSVFLNTLHDRMTTAIRMSKHIVY